MDKKSDVPKDSQDNIDDKLLELYSKKTIQYYKNPTNQGRMNDPDGAAWIDGICGDSMEMYLVIKGNTITDARFYTNGCIATIACGSMATELAKDKSIDEVLKISPGRVISALDGLPEEGYHCAILAISTLHKALSDYLLRKQRS